MSNDNEFNTFSSKNGNSWLERNDPRNIVNDEAALTRSTETRSAEAQSTEALTDDSQNSPPGDKRIVLRRIKSVKSNNAQPVQPVDDAPAPASLQTDSDFSLEFYPPMAQIVQQSGEMELEFVTLTDAIEPAPPAQPIEVESKLQQIDIAAAAIRDALDGASNETGVSNIPGIVLEQPEPSDAWIDEKKSRKGDRGSSTSKDTPVQDLDHDQIVAMVDTILDRFPQVCPAVLLFVGDEDNSQIDEATAKICAELERRDLGRILLVDSDFESRGLTNASGFAEDPGLAEAFSGSVHWRESVQANSGTQMEFLSAGRDRMHWYHVAPKQLDRITADMKAKYQYVCVSAGAAHSRSAKIWMNHCCGTYLIVSLQTSRETIAQSAVAELQMNGARLMGCVVTDLDPRP